MAATDWARPEPGRIARPADLLAAREARGWSRLDVARQIKFQVRQIAALEDGRFDDLPGRAFVRGALRSYGNLLEADVTPLLDAIGGHAEPAALTVPLRHSVAARMAELDVEFEPTVTQGRHASMAWGVGGVLAVIALLVYFGGAASLEQAERWFNSASDPGEALPAAAQAAGPGKGLVIEDVNWAVPASVQPFEVQSPAAGVGASAAAERMAPAVESAGLQVAKPNAASR